MAMSSRAGEVTGLASSGEAAEGFGARLSAVSRPTGSGFAGGRCTCPADTEGGTVFQPVDVSGHAVMGKLRKMSEVNRRAPLEVYVVS